jgi:hypothetical protein
MKTFFLFYRTPLSSNTYQDFTINIPFDKINTDLVIAFCHSSEFTFVDAPNKRCFLGARGLPPHLKSLKLQISEGGEYTVYENFQLDDLHLKSMNNTKRAYISYLKTMKYLRKAF